MRSVEAQEGAELLQIRTLRPILVYRILQVAVTDPHPAVEHLPGGQFEKFANDLIKTDPG